MSQENPAVVDNAKKAFDKKAEEERQNKIASLVDEIINLGATDAIIINRVTVQADDGGTSSEQRLLFNTLNVDQNAPLYAKIDYFANLSINLAQHFNEQRSILFRKDKIISLSANELLKVVNENKELRKRLNLDENEPLFDENNQPISSEGENGPKLEEVPASDKIQ